MAVPLLLLLLLLAAPATPQFSCPADQQGVFPDPDQCDKYWECGPGGRAARHLCPDGLAFHPSKPEGEDPCDHIHAVPDRCKKRPKLQKAKPGKTDLENIVGPASPIISSLSAVWLLACVLCVYNQFLPASLPSCRHCSFTAAALPAVDCSCIAGQTGQYPGLHCPVCGVQCCSDAVLQ